MPLIAFEGLDGTGKTSLIKRAEQLLRARGQQVISTCQPGGTDLGRSIRKLLTDTTIADPPSTKAELLLYQADRAHHMEQVIDPALKRGDFVLCDRFTGSSLAFQSGGRGLDVKAVLWLNDYSTEGVIPDHTVLLHLSVEESQKRRIQRGQALDRFEKEAQDFHRRVSEAYLYWAKKNNWIVLDAALSEEVLFEKLIAKIPKFFQK